MIANTTLAYAAQNTKISPAQAVTLTSLVGDKPDFWACDNYNGAINVLSVAYQPAQFTLWAAWENGMGATWSPAALSKLTLVCACAIQIS